MSDANPFQTPMAGGGQPAPMGPKPDNYLVYAILVTLCCCLPCGIVGIIYAAQVDSKWNAGDQAGAIAYANSAKTWTMAGLIIGLIGNLIAIGIQVLMVAGAAAGGGGGGGF